MIAANDRNWAIYANAMGLLVFTNIPFISLIATIVLWYRVRRDDSMPFATAHATFALRMQIIWTGLALAGVILTFHNLVAFLITYLGLCVLNAIISVVGCWKASAERLP